MKILLSFLIAFGLLLNSSLADPTVSTGLSLVDLNGNVIAPTSGSTYDVPLGTTFFLRANASISNPHYTDSDHSSPLINNVPLGINLIAGDIASDQFGIVRPVANPSSGSAYPTWSRFRSVGRLLTPSFVNLVMAGEIPSAAGVITTFNNLYIDDPENISLYQVGANGPADLFEGLYSATTAGSTNLIFNPTSIVIFTEHSSIGDGLQPHMSYASYSGAMITAYTRPIYDHAAPITINVIDPQSQGLAIVPEPGALSIVAFAALGTALTIYRRKRAEKSLGVGARVTFDLAVEK